MPAGYVASYFINVLRQTACLMVIQSMPATLLPSFILNCKLGLRLNDCSLLRLFQKDSFHLSMNVSRASRDFTCGFLLRYISSDCQSPLVRFIMVLIVISERTVTWTEHIYVSLGCFRINDNVSGDRGKVSIKCD